VTICQARPQGCNEPTKKAVDGTRQILDFVQRAGKNDCVVALISGGGSALLCSPIEGVTLEDKVEVTRALSAAGANIEELNSVRRCLSHIKGGGLARACNARKLITCIISDVLGDPLDVIASGPTILKPSPAPSQAIDVMNRFLPNQFQSIRNVLNQQLLRNTVAGKERQYPPIELVPIVLANNATAVDAAGQKAVELGYRYWMKSERRSEGDAIQLGQRFAQQMHSTLEQDQIDCIISGGEPTVVLPPATIRGLGGRNQQVTLAFLDWFSKNGGWPTKAEMAFVSGGTDGEDGPTDAAGAYVDSSVYSQMQSQPLNPEDYLKRCDAYRFFEQTGGLLKTGPTGTNVCDLRVGLVRK
jgi:glycerate-2-kinase